jgi:hypothetical protein
MGFRAGLDILEKTLLDLARFETWIVHPLT